MIIREMKLEEAERIKEIDRSERINLIYENSNKGLKEVRTDQECPTWNTRELDQLLERFRIEITEGGIAYGAFENECLIGFGVLCHKLRGKNKDRLQIDLMYVTRNFRRKGIGKQLINELSKEAINRDAKFLYISSTETE